MERDGTHVGEFIYGGAGIYKRGFVDGQYTNARFNYPQGADHDSNRNVTYVADSQNNAIREIDHTTGYVSTLCSGLYYNPVDICQGDPVQVSGVNYRPELFAVCTNIRDGYDFIGKGQLPANNIPAHIGNCI